MVAPVIAAALELPAGALDELKSQLRKLKSLQKGKPDGSDLTCEVLKNAAGGVSTSELKIESVFSNS